jgi:hypothetical protein
MKPVLLFRKELASKYELRHAERYFPIKESRMKCRDSLVIGRYSVLPYYNELERDLGIIGSRLANSFDEHRWITSYHDTQTDRLLMEVGADVLHGRILSVETDGGCTNNHYVYHASKGPPNAARPLLS